MRRRTYVLDSNVEPFNHYLTFSSVNYVQYKYIIGEEGPFNSLEYSINGGKTWTALPPNTYTPEIEGEVLWRGQQSTFGENKYRTFSGTQQYNASGDPLSLIYGSNIMNEDYYNSIQLENYCNQRLFEGDINLVSAAISLFHNNLSSYCYYQMFKGCTSLQYIPQSLYEVSFNNISRGCFQSMFEDCSSIDINPYNVNNFRLYPQTLKTECYSAMFKNCTSLTRAPYLPALTLVDRCYNEMFYGCSSLNYIKAMFLTTPSNSYTHDWVVGVASEGVFVKNKDATWTLVGDKAIPSGWAVTRE